MSCQTQLWVENGLFVRNLSVVLLLSQALIKTHGSESRGQETTKRTPN